MNLFPVFIKSPRRAGQIRGGYINIDGDIVIPPEFDGVTQFREGLASVQVGAKWGLIDENGVTTVKPFSDRSVSFAEDRGVFSRQEKVGVINRCGEVLISPQFYIVGDFSEGLAYMANFGAWNDKPGCYGFLTRDGSIKIPYFFDDARGFHEGLAAVKVNGKWGFIEPGGAFKIEAQFEAAIRFSEGLARVKADDLWGYIDCYGTHRVARSFNSAREFSEGLAEVEKARHWGFINKSGEFEIPPSFTRTGRFSEGLAKVESEGLIGFIDRSGEMRIEAQFRMAGDYKNGLAFVETTDEIGYINQQGKFVWRAPHVEVGLVAIS